MLGRLLGRLVGEVVGRPVLWVGRGLCLAARTRADRAMAEVPEQSAELPEVPEPPRWVADPPGWALPVVVLTAIGGAFALELSRRGDRRADPDRRSRTSEQAARDPDPSESGEEAVEEALNTLEVDRPPAPSQEDVRAAYRRRTLETHPDQGGEAEEFIEVREAWETVAQRQELSAGDEEQRGN